MFTSEADQRVRRDRSDLQEYVEIEDVAGEDDAVHPGHHQQKQAQVFGLGGVLLHITGAEEHRSRAHDANRHQQQPAETVEHEIDAERNGPAPDLIDPRAPQRPDRHHQQRHHHKIGQ